MQKFIFNFEIKHSGWSYFLNGQTFLLPRMIHDPHNQPVTERSP